MSAWLRLAAGWLLAGAAAAQSTDYTEARACAACHAEIAGRYARSAMARSFGAVEPDGVPAGRFRHEASGQNFTIAGRALARDAGGHTLERTIDYWIGSGNHARGYITRGRSGALFELPLTWYAENGGYWSMSPGYDQPEHAGFSRPIPYRCVFCHSAYPESEPSEEWRPAPRYPARMPGGVDCQRCHGPGRRHVESAKRGRPAAEILRTIVNPRRLPADRQAEVCLQCHLETTSSRLPAMLPRFGRGVFSFRPGEPLAASLLHFDHAPGTGHDDKFEFASSAYRLRKSACFLESKAALTCTTCHDPHDTAASEASAERYTSACRRCHQSLAASHPGVGACASCHMPKRRPSDAIHVSVTDHKIQKPGAAAPAPERERNDSNTPPYRGEVALYYPAALPPRPENEMYLAVAQVRHGANLPGGLPRLERAIAAANPRTGDFHFELAEGYRQAGQPAKAVSAYREAAARAPSSWRFLSALGTGLAAAGDLAASEDALRRAVKLGPGETAPLLALAQTLLRRDKLAEARDALEQARALDPDSADALNSLGALRLRMGQTEAAEEAFREAVRLRPELAPMRNNLAAALLRLGRTEEAIREYRAAVALRPDSPAIHYNLASALAGLGRLDDAALSLRAAIRLAPDYFEAHLKLGQVLIQRGEKAEAVGHLKKAEMSPDERVRQAARESLR